MNISEDRGVGIIYLPTKFQLLRFISNGDLLSDRNHWKHIHTDRHTNTQTKTDTLPIFYKGSSKHPDIPPKVVHNS